jgi:hypothetical protein
MKLGRIVLVVPLVLMIAAGPAAAQHIVRMPASGQKPTFTFTKEAGPGAPIPRLDLSPMFEVADQDVEGALRPAALADEAGMSGWVVGGLAAVGLGALILTQVDPADATSREPAIKEGHDQMFAVGAGFVIVGLGLTMVGVVKGLDQSPHAWIGKTRGGVAGGVRIPIGRR